MVSRMGSSPTCEPVLDSLPGGKTAMRESVLRDVLWTLAAGLLTAALAAVMISCLPNAFWRDDFQAEYLPGCADIDRALREGSFPLLSPYCWFGGDLAGKYGFGIFSVVHLLVIFVVFHLGLSLAQTAIAIVLTYVVITAGGAFRLGRHYGLTIPTALIVCLAATLNGWSYYWGARSWTCAFSGCAWLPWAWWTLAIAVDDRYGVRRFLPAGIFLYLLLAAGWPYGVLMAAVVTIWLFARTSGLWHPLKSWPVVAAWALGLALAAPALLTFLEFYSHTVRAAHPPGDSSLWSVPFFAMPGMIFPSSVAAWRGWGSNLGLRPSYELYCGLVPGVAVLAGLIRYRMAFVRQYRWELGLLVVVALLCHFGAVGTFRYAFRWLPLFHLLIGLLGALVVQRWCLETPSRDRLLTRIQAGRSLGLWSLVFLLVCGEWTLYATPLPYFANFKWTREALLGLSLLWMAGECFLAHTSRLHAWLPVMVMAAGLVMTSQVHTESTVQWSYGESIRQRSTFEENTTYLAILSWDDIFRDIPVGGPIDAWCKPVCYFGNTPMYASLRFMNGYDAMGTLPGYGRLFHMDWIGQTGDPARIVRTYASPGGLLRLLGVDGLILGRHEMFEYAGEIVDQGWKCTAKSGYGAVFHRNGPRAPRVWSVTDVDWVNDGEEMLNRLAGPAQFLRNVLVADHDSKGHVPPVLAKADIADVQENRLSVRCTVSNPRDASYLLVAFGAPTIQATARSSRGPSCPFGS